MSREFINGELKSFDGKNGKPAYISYNGAVYDVSDSAQWADGEHFGMHTAGDDLTNGIDAAPHGPEVFDILPKVGVLKD
ncbi:MAG: cytochrome B5 [Deltaproteobacteria bacterium GWC2_42_11]|nr:MAG: cytochrome B5 [Deltaproteobacteria bacterium GWC2_42_11]